METILEKFSILINRVLELDEETVDALAQYQGRRLAVFISGTGNEIYITIEEYGVELSLVPDAEPDVSIRGTPPEFLAFLRSTSDRSAARSSLEISGDIALAQEIQAVLRRLDLDWEEYLSEWTGDTLARRLGNLVRQSSRFLQDTGETLRGDISEYLRYEKEILPDRTEVEEFNAAVDTLRDDVERLKLRLDRLQRSGKT